MDGMPQTCFAHHRNVDWRSVVPSRWRLSRIRRVPLDAPAPTAEGGRTLCVIVSLVAFTIGANWPLPSNQAVTKPLLPRKRLSQAGSCQVGDCVPKVAIAPLMAGTMALAGYLRLRLVASTSAAR
jgi:hypothetical protein